MLFNNGLKLIYKYWLTLIYTENRNLECPIISVSSLCFTFYVIMACRLKEIFVSTFLLSCFVFLRSWVRMIATTSFSQVHFLEISRNHFLSHVFRVPRDAPSQRLWNSLIGWKLNPKLRFNNVLWLDDSLHVGQMDASLHIDPMDASLYIHPIDTSLHIDPVDALGHRPLSGSPILCILLTCALSYFEVSNYL